MSTITTSESLVILLRRGVTYLNDATVIAAADEIERLRAERDEARQKVEQLRAERDEARRKVCHWECEADTDWIDSPFPMQQSTPRMFALLHGWDCFKKER
jgi:chromosome condensin MukBEF ATPase and DNA-binding subunit MukB